MKNCIRILSIVLVILLGLNIGFVYFAEEGNSSPAAEVPPSSSESGSSSPDSGGQSKPDSEAPSSDSEYASSESQSDVSGVEDDTHTEQAPTPTLTPTPTPADTPTPTPTPQASGMPEQADGTPTPIPELSPSPTPAPTNTPAPTQSDFPQTSADPAETADPTETADPETESGITQEDEPVPSVEPEMPSESEQPVQEDIEETETPDGEHEVIIKRAYSSEWYGKVPDDDEGMPVPILYQGDYKQPLCIINGEVRTVASSGCGATSLSMIIAYLTGNTEQTPYTLFRDAIMKSGYYGTGLSHSILSMLAGEYGVYTEWIPNDRNLIIDALKNGKPIVAHMGAGMFTKGGHYIVLRGITDDGLIIVNDPASRSHTGKAYPVELFLTEARRDHAFMVCWVDNMPQPEDDASETEAVDQVVVAMPILYVEGQDATSTEYLMQAELTKADSEKVEQTVVENIVIEERIKAEIEENQTLVGNALNLYQAPVKMAGLTALKAADRQLQVEPMEVEYVSADEAEEEPVAQKPKMAVMLRAASPKMLTAVETKSEEEMTETRVLPIEIEYVSEDSEESATDAEQTQLRSLRTAAQIEQAEKMASTSAVDERTDDLQEQTSAVTQQPVRGLEPASANVAETSISTDESGEAIADSIELLPMETEHSDLTEESVGSEAEPENLNEDAETTKGLPKSGHAEAESEMIEAEAEAKILNENAETTKELPKSGHAEVEPELIAQADPPVVTGSGEAEAEPEIIEAEAEPKPLNENAEITKELPRSGHAEVEPEVAGAIFVQETQESRKDSAVEEADSSVNGGNREPTHEGMLWFMRDTLEPVPAGKRKVITQTARLYMRNQPDQREGDVIGMIAQIQSELELIDIVHNEDTGEDWYQISANGVKGYICGRFARIADAE